MFIKDFIVQILFKNRDIDNFFFDVTEGVSETPEYIESVQRGLPFKLEPDQILYLCCRFVLLTIVILAIETVMFNTVVKPFINACMNGLSFPCLNSSLVEIILAIIGSAVTSKASNDIF